MRGGGEYMDTIIPTNKKLFYEMNSGGLHSVDKSKVYFFGIIDVFTYYNTKKQIERVVKAIRYDEKTVSCVPPKDYAKRFHEFMDDGFE